MTRNGYNVLAALAIGCATLIVALGKDLTFAMSLVAIAGTISGRGGK